jgi:hypothetical protein
MSHYTPEESEKISYHTEKFVKALKEGNDDEFFKNLGLAMETHDNREGVIYTLTPEIHDQFVEVVEILTRIIVANRGSVEHVGYYDTNGEFSASAPMIDIPESGMLDFAKAMAIMDGVSFTPTTDDTVSIEAIMHNVRRELPGRATV